MAEQAGSTSVFTYHANPCVDEVRPYVPGPTAAMISERYGLPLDQLVKLSSNEAPLGASPKVQAALHQIADSDGLHRYPSPTAPELRKAIGKLLGVPPDQILPGAGSTDTWPLIVRAYSFPGEEVLAVEPSMTSYAEVAVLSERTPSILTMEFPFDVTAHEVIERVTPQTRVIFLCSPNNTTSRLIAPAIIEEIANGAPDAIVVVDEHYIETADDYRAVTAVNLLPRTSNVLVTRSFSKQYGLAGIRVGYAVGPEAVISTLMKFKAKWNISLVADVAARAALEDQEHLERNVAVTREGRAYFEKALRQMSGIELVPEAQGCFVLFRVLSRPAAEVVEQLFQRGIMVRGDLLEDYIRLSVGTPEQNEQFVSALEAAM